MENKYKTLAANIESIESGHVWIQGANIKSQRAICKITNTKNNKSTYCETLKIDSNYKKNRNNRPSASKICTSINCIVLNQWYRTKLGIEKTGDEVSLHIEEENNCWGNLASCLNHPQVAIRLSATLGLLSAVLGIIGLALGLLSVL